MFRLVRSKIRRRLERWVTNPRCLRFVAGAMQRHVPGNDAAALFAEHGYTCLREHFYSAVPLAAERQYQTHTELVGVDICEERCQQFLSDVVMPFANEFQQLADSGTADPEAYRVANGTFMAVDGQVYYGVLRHFEPENIVEIGAGNSTRLASAAIARNIEQDRRASRLITVDPYAAEGIERLPHVERVIRTPIQECDLSMFETLDAGDVLFIDSTHVVRAGGDVLWEFCEILPRLKPDVLVHVHDIYWPHPYPETFFENHWHWSEQYLLQAFLTFNPRFEILWAGSWLFDRIGDELSPHFEPAYSAMLAEYPEALPASFWMRVR